MATSAGPRIQAWAEALEAAMGAGDKASVTELFHEDCQWRDLVLLTWDIRTFAGREKVARALTAAGHRAGFKNGSLRENIDSEKGVAGSCESCKCSGWMNVCTKLASGVAQLQLQRGDDGRDRCSVLFTAMTKLKEFEESVDFRRPVGHSLEAQSKSTNAPELRGPQEPYVLVVGGSQCGLMLAARLKQLQVPTLVVDKLPSPGENWRRRYGSLHLHDPCWVCEFPYLKFPESWPVYPSKDQFADWLDTYAKIMEINFQGETEVLRAAYKISDAEWEVEVLSGGQVVTLNPKHLVLATGNSSIPQIPTFAGQDCFEGRLVHSSQFSGCQDDAAWYGKKCIIVGSNTSAHDIAQDLWEHGGQVTMLQRSQTCVLKTKHIRDLCAQGGYSQEGSCDGSSTAEKDLKSESMPYSLREPDMKAWVQAMKHEDVEYYRDLEKIGWRQSWGEDGTGPYMMFIRRFCGYYFDIGASKLLIDGHVQLRRAEITEVRPKSVVLSSGEEMPCDNLILATGYKNMSEWVARLISPAAAKSIGDVWGLGRGENGAYEGELQNMWKPTAQEGLWFQGGNLKLSRFHSLHLALQLKARYEKLPFKVYSEEEAF
eukprot:CAMPEP_0197628452 /NCGR_PEP_ID=MMETSP1338-20131121/6760_1 /TAXON_ID=43686 ORGANISM="Pelagodinium beii, Strain RCC1491" /NCGR_SAMPLE_ID=MMETSP1338 /ASSEMBLY_ACC=CAM_ASM_000754 /LENGTH=598 /DNA_ID=CAMNT_0043199433 /DNA_START=69 /DNA_END=1862 /DNA_ORIENTATION=+